MTDRRPTSPPRLLLLAACVLAPGCIIKTHGTVTVVETAKIPASQLAELRPGAPADFVLAVLGPPRSRTIFEGGVEVWRYDDGVEVHDHGPVTVRIGDDEKSVHVELTDGRVVRTWRE